MTTTPHNPPPAAPGAKARRPWFTKKRFIIPGALAAVLVIGSTLSNSGSPTPDDKPASSASASTSDATDTADVTTKKTKAPKPSLTAGQENALSAAENYLSFAPFSRKGLIGQLSSDAGDGYSKADATYAADHVEVDYKKQAVKAAKAYLDISPFSRAGMIDQLSSSAGDGYTREQAEYGAIKAGL